MDKRLTDLIPLFLKESTSRVVNPSSSISECLIVVTLPQELITEILVRLPVESLLRFKCVSKPWLSLISDPQFIRSHFSKSTSTEAGDLNPELLFASRTSMTKCSLYSALHDDNPSMYLSVIEPPAQNMYSIVVGIINGLVCLKLEETDLCLWNPALNKMKHFNFYPEPPSDTVKCIFSFGYEESSDDYKVVCLQSERVGDGFSREANICNVTSIYSLKADSWKRIDDLKGFYLPCPGVFANGKIYWLGNLFGNPNVKNVGLDMSSEKFVELQPPEYDAGHCLSKMGVSGGQPFVLCVYHSVMKVDLWVLGKRGVEECWCKLVSYPYAELGHDVLSYNYRVVCISSKGEIVLGDEHDGLIVYNWKKKESRKIKLDVDITTNWRIAAYVESLVWPDYA